MKIYGFTTRSVKKPLFEINKEDLNKIPFYIIMDAVQFFRCIFYVQRTEASLVISYENDVWSLMVPDQEVSYASVDADNKDMSGMVGTIHSHCDFTGKFSPTDLDDQKKIPGLHIVIGDLDKELSFDCQLVLNKYNIVSLNIEDIVEDFDYYKDILTCPPVLSSENLEKVVKEKKEALVSKLDDPWKMFDDDYVGMLPYKGIKRKGY